MPLLAVLPRVTYGLDIDPTAKRELEVTLAARQELGTAHDDALVAGFLERIDGELDRRVVERLGALAPRKPRKSVVHPANLALCIPIVAVSGGLAGAPGVIVALIALVTVFLVTELRT
jgi:hypothetical protein